MLTNSISFRGGARIGWVNATWPFAILTTQQNELVLNVKVLGKYSFTPDQVIALEKSSGILSSGVRIHHNNPNYTKKIVFWPSCNPQKLIDKIESTGFAPGADPSSLPPERGMPVRWQAIITIIVLWNVLSLLDMSFPDDFMPLCLLFLGSVGIWRFKTLQNIILKPGRSPTEIKAWLNLFALISGMMLLFISISTFNQLNRKDSFIPYTKIDEFDDSFEITSGKTIVPGTWDWDIESNLIGARGKNDIWWQHVSITERNLVPQNDARLALVSAVAFDDIDLEYLKRIEYYDKKLSDSDMNPVLLEGTIIALLTAEGNLAKLRITGFRQLHDFSFKGSELLDEEWRSFVLTKKDREKFHIEFDWILYKKQYQ